MTSNWKELRSILIALRKERVKADNAGVRTPLWRTRIYHLTDNLVSESILTKGTSSSPKLQQLLREIALEQQLQQCDLIPMHVAGKRLIYQGTDGLSRGQKNAGSLSGDVTDVRGYNPLATAPAPIPGPLQTLGHSPPRRPDRAVATAAMDSGPHTRTVDTLDATAATRTGGNSAVSTTSHGRTVDNVGGLPFYRGAILRRGGACSVTLGPAAYQQGRGSIGSWPSTSH